MHRGKSVGLKTEIRLIRDGARAYFEVVWEVASNGYRNVRENRDAFKKHYHI